MTKDKNLEKFLRAIGARESGGKYDNDKNPSYHGMYQMGKLALAEAGYFDMKKNKFTGKNGIYTKKDFLNNPAAQEDAVRLFERSQWKQIQAKCASNYNKKVVNGIKITDSGLLAGAHLVGANETCKYLKSDGKYIPKDGNGTSIEEYIKKFGGFDISELTNSSLKKDFYPELSKKFTKTSTKTLKGHVSLTTGLDNVKRITGKDFLNQALSNNNEKLNRYEEILYQSMLKSSSKKAETNNKVNVTGQTLKDVLDTQYQKLKTFKDKIYMESNSIKKRFTGEIPKDYKNPETDSDKIFTKEEIKSMNWAQTKKFQKAIRYQEKTIGIPSKAQAAKTASEKGSGLIHVTGYTTSNGRKVEDYYRALPRK